MGWIIRLAGVQPLHQTTYAITGLKLKAVLEYLGSTKYLELIFIFILLLFIMYILGNWLNLSDKILHSFINTIWSYNIKQLSISPSTIRNKFLVKFLPTTPMKMLCLIYLSNWICLRYSWRIDNWPSKLFLIYRPSRPVVSVLFRVLFSKGVK